VFFIMDTTGSMGRAIEGLKNSVLRIASELRGALGKDACFGIGDVKDDTTLEGGQVAVDRVYRTHQKIVCEEPKLPLIRNAIAQLDEGGGGSNPAEAQTIALTQAVTGTGQTKPFVAPDMDAEFRPQAFRVIVLISDVEFQQEPQSPGYPSIAETVDTLNSAGVKVVSVLVNGNNELEPARADMEAVARGTETYAPSRGVDCDGDGKMTQFDLAPFEPLVCEADGSDPNIGPAVIGLLLGVVDPGSIGVEVYDDHDLVQHPIEGLTHDVRNLKLDSHLEFTLPIMCRKEQDGLDLPIDLQGTVRNVGALNAQGRILVQCRADPVPPPPRVPPQQEPFFEPPKQRPPVAAAVQPPQPPAQPISNMNLNAGFSQQEEQQYQLAAVTQGAQETELGEEEIELAMSRLDPERDVAAATGLLGGATALSVLAGVAYRRRLQRASRTRVVRVR
jgi:hypothetical protein